MSDVDDLDELDLFDQHDLEGGDTDASSGQSQGSDEEGEEMQAMTEEQYNQLKGTVVDITTAMGGIEEVMDDENGNVEMVYVLGDDCLRCLRDLRKLWRDDEEDYNRTIPRIFAEVNLLQTGLLPLLLKTTDMGEKGRKIALACTDLITTITWPIDRAAELQAAYQREDDDGNALASLHVLEKAYVSYKSSVLRARSRETKGSKRSVLSSIMLFVLLPALSKPRHHRVDRDVGIISMCLHLIRNLLAIQDPVATSLSSADAITESSLQSDLIVELDSARMMDTLLMLSSNAASKEYENWNVIACECVYYIFIGTRPEDLMKKEVAAVLKPTSMQQNRIAPPPPPAQDELTRLLAAEAKEQIEKQKVNGSSRHSRFNTMINYIDQKGNRRVASGQAALRKSVDTLTREAEERFKRKGGKRRRALVEKGAAVSRAPWSPKAMITLSAWAEKFLQVGFEELTRSVLEDIRREKAKVGDLDQARTRIMQLGVFFLHYFLKQRQAQAQLKDGANSEVDRWPFSLVSQWTQPWALRMAYVRCSSSYEKKQWLEYVSAIQLWTILFKVIEALSKSTEEDDRTAAEGLQVEHFYDQAALDCAKSVLGSYTTQSFTCLRSIIAFAQIMPRMLEKYSKNNENMYVKAKAQLKKSRNDAEGELVVAEDEVEAQTIAKDEAKERKFEFQKFQSKMASNNLADACLQFLSRWQEIHHDEVSEQLGNIVQVLHRLAIKVGDTRLFFPFKRRMVLKQLQDSPSFQSFVKRKAPAMEEELRKFIHYVLRKFEKLDEDEKSRWGEGMSAPKAVKAFKMPAEIEIRPSRGHVDDVGIAVGLLMEKDRLQTVIWIKSNLEEACRVKEKIVEEERSIVGDMSDDEGSDEEGGNQARERAPPAAAFERFAAFPLLYNNDDDLQSEASTVPEVKLLCRLLGLQSDESDTHRWSWTIPADSTPFELTKDIQLLEDYIRQPLEVFGESFSSLVSRVRKVPVRAVKKKVVVNEHGDEEEILIRKTKGRRKEKLPEWVDNDFIEDSDEELAEVARLIDKERERIEDLDEDADVRNLYARSSSNSSSRSSSPRSSRPALKRVQSSSSTMASSRRTHSSSDNTSPTPQEQSPTPALTSPKATITTKRKGNILFFESDEEEEEMIYPVRKQIRQSPISKEQPRLSIRAHASSDMSD